MRGRIRPNPKVFGLALIEVLQGIPYASDVFPQGAHQPFMEDANGYRMLPLAGDGLGMDSDTASRVLAFFFTTRPRVAPVP